MKKFYNYTEQLMLTISPKSDSVGAVDHETEEKPTDMFNTAADDIMSNFSDDTVQPDENVGETGENQSESTNGVDLECMGDEGVKVKFNGLEILLPTDVIEAIKSFNGADESESHDENESEESHEEHENEETPEEEAEEHADGESESEEKEVAAARQQADQSQQKQADGAVTRARAGVTGVCRW